MRYVRLKIDNAGESHFEQATLDLNEADYRPPAPLTFVSHTYLADGFQFIRLPSGWAENQSIHPRSIPYLLEGPTRSDGQRRRKADIRSGQQRVDGGCHRERSSNACQGHGRVIAAIIPIAINK